MTEVDFDEPPTPAESLSFFHSEYPHGTASLAILISAGNRKMLARQIGAEFDEEGLYNIPGVDGRAYLGDVLIYKPDNNLEVYTSDEFTNELKKITGYDAMLKQWAIFTQMQTAFLWLS